MNHKYLPHTEHDIKVMLRHLRVRSLDGLFAHLPASLLNHGKLPKKLYATLKAPLSDSQLVSLLEKHTSKPLITFKGFGAYDHERPALIDALVSRQEFLTSYTPYQPEVAQGTLQYIFEFQTLICELTKMEVSNASMYDGATATAEAMMMAVNIKNINRILVSDSLLPQVIDVIKTYAHFREVAVEIIPSINGVIDDQHEAFKTPFAALIVPMVNRYGIIEPLAIVENKVHLNNGLLIVYTDLLMASIFKPPGLYKADIVSGEAQTLGIPLSFGGPYLGFLATNKTYVRKMPGRICGMSKDNRNQRAYVLTLQAREQHIRREKANSNICSNQSLMALQATIYLASLGKLGFYQVAHRVVSGAHYLAKLLVETKLFTLTYQQPYAHEVTLTYHHDVNQLNRLLLKKGYLSGQPLNDHDMVFYVNEKMMTADIKKFVKAIVEVDHEIR